MENPVKLSASPTTIGVTLLLSEHTREVLELGFDTARIDALRAEGAI